MYVAIRLPCCTCPLYILCIFHCYERGDIANAFSSEQTTIKPHLSVKRQA